MKLYEIGSEIYNAIELYNHVETDEELRAIEEKLNGLQVSFDDKCISIAKHIRNTEATEEALTAEINRLTARRQTIRGRVEWFKGYIKRSMEATNTQKIESDLFRISIRKNGGDPKVFIDDESKIPDSYKRTIPESKVVEKDRIVEAWKNGIGVDGARVERGTHLSIK